MIPGNFGGGKESTCFKTNPRRGPEIGVARVCVLLIVELLEIEFAVLEIVGFDESLSDADVESD